MTSNVIRTGVSSSLPRPPMPDDGWEWIPVVIYGEWRFLRGSKIKEAGA
jgi:hypothetical protein